MSVKAVGGVITSLAELQAAGYPMDRTEMLLNSPIVAEGSTARARLAGGSAELSRGWYRDQVSGA